MCGVWISRSLLSDLRRFIVAFADDENLGGFESRSGRLPDVHFLEQLLEHRNQAGIVSRAEHLEMQFLNLICIFHPFTLVTKVPPRLRIWVANLSAAKTSTFWLKASCIQLRPTFGAPSWSTTSAWTVLLKFFFFFLKNMKFYKRKIVRFHFFQPANSEAPFWWPVGYPLSWCRLAVR